MIKHITDADINRLYKNSDEIADGENNSERNTDNAVIDHQTSHH
jgi:hypothetical protein